VIQEVPRVGLSNGAVRFHSRRSSAALRVVGTTAQAEFRFSPRSGLFHSSPALRIRARTGPDRTRYSARLNTASSVTSFTNGLLNFNSLSVSEVMLRFSEGFPVRFAKVLAWISRLRTMLVSSNEYLPK
jgi:hypothetical protein